VVTVEFKINLLRPAVGDSLLCSARVLKPGRTLSIAESEIFAEREGAPPVLVAKLMATLAIIPRP
jgi:acyl-coenzyme A thioesterase PaaI-like protein